jgi:hypothetical protein
MSGITEIQRCFYFKKLLGGHIPDDYLLNSLLKNPFLLSCCFLLLAAMLASLILFGEYLRI